MENKLDAQGQSRQALEGGRYRARLLALFVLTGLLAGALIFVKFQLEHFRQALQTQVEETLGTRFDVGEVAINGLRGLRIADFSAVFASDDGPSVAIDLPDILIDLDLLDLFSRRMTIERVHLNGGVVVVTREGDQEILGGYFERYLRDAGLGDAVSFRVTGENCAVRVENLVGESAVAFDEVHFDCSRLSGSPDISASIRGRMDGEDEKTFHFRLRYTHSDDFDLRMEHELLRAEDINRFLPAPQQFVTDGVLSASARLSGYPGAQYVLGMEAQFRDLHFREQPPFLAPAAGTLSLLASYDPDESRLQVTAAELNAPELSGTLAGSVSFAETSPEFDLRFSTRNLSARDLLSQYLDTSSTAFAGLTVDLEDDYLLVATLEGTAAAPIVSVGGHFSRGAIAYQPASPALPVVNLQTGMTQFAWESATGAPSGAMNITGGVIVHPAMGLRAENVTGVLSLDATGFTLEPFAAMVTGNPVSGSLRFDQAKSSATFQLAGTVAGLEQFAFVQDLEDIHLSGSATIRCSGTITPSRYLVDLQVDATQAVFGFEWWLEKPLGTGATFSGVHIDLVPRKSMNITGNFLLDAAQGSVALDLEHASTGWRLNTARARSEHIGITTLDKCLNIGYKGVTGALENASLEWKRTGETMQENTLEIRGNGSYAEAVPEGGAEPHRLAGAVIRLLFDSSGPGIDKTTLDLHADSARLPAFGETWFVPLRPKDSVLAAKYPPTPRVWEINLSAEHLEISPWAGTDFTGRVQIASDLVTVESFSATVGEGSVRGSYSLEEIENLMTLNATWEKVPATTILRHLNFPELLTGTMNGAIAYTIDLDDPNTLQGSGAFDIQDGLFSADFLFAQLEERMQGNMTNLPPSLRFSRIRSDVLFSGDRITTNGLLLESEGVTLSGNGNFVIDGDLDYHLDLSVTPETAERIPALKDNLNIEGHRISQNNIQLGFHVTGPTFAPSGAVTGVPSVGVTLVSGAFELTSEAIKVIDIPRQILIDLFKIGGGLMGATK